MEPSGILPTWAPRVKQRLIQRLYESDAQSLLDENLLNEIGWALVERCKSFIAANLAVHGRAPCPVCGAIIEHQARPETILRCPACGWENTWKNYFHTIQHKQLSGAAEVIALFQDFIDRFTAAREAPHKMLLVDTLIHSWHWNVHFNTNTRAAGVNLIEGSYHEVVDFLDRLSCGPGSTPGVSPRHAEWREQVNYTSRLWQDVRLCRNNREED